MDKELREWLGIRPADLLIYAAIAVAGLMYFIDNGALDLTAAVVSLVLCTVSCVLGMKRDPELSGLTNFMKKIGYPICVLVCLALIFLNYWYWNSK